MRLNRREAGAAVAALLVGASRPTAAQAPAAPLPAATFFQEPQLSAAVLAPSGRAVALRIGGKDTRVRLAVLDLETMKVQPVASFTDADVHEFRWVNDRRLVFSLSDNRLAAADQRLAFGLFAVDADGQRFRQLAQREPVFVQDGIGTRQLPWNTFLLDQAGAQTGDEVLVVQPAAYSEKGLEFFAVLRLDTVSGRFEELPAPTHAQRWLVDDQGNLRAALVVKDSRAAIHVRDTATGTWRATREWGRYTGPEIALHWAGPDGRLHVTAQPSRDTAAVYAYDPATDTLAEPPLLAVAGYDIDPVFVHDDHRLLGLRFTVDAEVTQWFDEALKSVQAELDRQLGGTVNRIDVPRRGNSPWVLVTAFSDVQPHEFLLLHTGTKKLTRLGGAQPEVRPPQMATMDLRRYKARDGLEIPAYLTLPRGAEGKNLPLLLWVHGGPWVRGARWEWQPEVQFLASRGYAVLQPEFRGSTGFGGRHFRAGWQQWGLAMQDDLADGARWAVAQGLADPKRIAIIGASYGGYAALMGLVKDPELFRCAVSWAGVSDLDLFYTARWDDIPPAFKRWGLPALLGDREKDASRLKATSPLVQAARIRNPLLLAHGGADRRVPIEHGRRLRDAVRAHNEQLVWIEYPKEGHGWALPETRVDFWTRVEAFLARHLAAG